MLDSVCCFLSDRGIYQLIEAYMLSLRSGPLAEDLKQQVAAVTGEVEGAAEVKGVADVEGTAAEVETAPQTTPTCAREEEEEEEEPLGEVEYHLDYCVDKYAIGYKPQVLYPACPSAIMGVNKTFNRPSKNISTKLSSSIITRFLGVNTALV